MRQVIIFILILALKTFAYAITAPSGYIDASVSKSVVQNVFPDANYESLSKMFENWTYSHESLAGEWKFILFSIDPKAKPDLWWVISVDQRVLETGFRNNFDGSEYNILSISPPRMQNVCEGAYYLEIRNIFYSGLNQGPHCLHDDTPAIAFEFQQFGITPSLDWKTDAWYSYQCRNKSYGNDVFMLCKVAIDGDWLTGDTEWNLKIKKWLGKSFSYFGFWKKKTL